MRHKDGIDMVHVIANQRRYHCLLYTSQAALKTVTKRLDMAAAKHVIHKNQASNRKSGPVSYTHLDVYKRQDLDRATDELVRVLDMHERI